MRAASAAAPRRPENRAVRARTAGELCRRCMKDLGIDGRAGADARRWRRSTSRQAKKATRATMTSDALTRASASASSAACTALVGAVVSSMRSA